MIQKSYAKVNICLKITGKKDNHHKLVSRFVRVKNFFDIIKFEKCNCNQFTLEGNFGCETKKNTIYKAYVIFSDQFPIVEEYFKTHKVIVDKKIPEFSGLGGGSSNCATFIHMINDVCNLNFTKNELASIGILIGADIPFFIYEYDSANVSGIGEIVKKFDEEVLNIKVFTPKIKCDTGKIFTSFRDKFYKEIKDDKAKKLLSMKSKDILKSMTIGEANDLYKPAVNCCPKLKQYAKIGWYFSGSGSSFFKILGK